MNPYRELAQRLVTLEQRVNGGSSPQLANSSLESTSINEYDGNGQLAAILGRQPDGTHGVSTVSGPTPPRPTAPTVVPVLGGLRISWDGEFVGEPPADPSVAPTPAFAPMDFARVEVHVSINPSISTNGLPRTSIESPRGGEVIPGTSYDTSYWVAFATRSTSGKVSALSEVVGPFVALKATREDLDVDFESLSGTTIFYGAEEPVTTKADLWLRAPDNTAWRFDLGTSTWVQVRDQGIVQALQEAAAANQAADQAGIDALAATGAAGAATDVASAAQTKANEAAQAAADAAQAALDAAGVASAAQATADTAQNAADAASADALAAAGLADSKGRVYYQTSAPTPGDPNGLWIDTDDGNKPYRWIVDSWSAVENTRIQAAANAAGTAQGAADAAQAKADQAVADAAAAAQAAADAATLAGNAQTTANSKITLYRQSSPPSGGTYKPQADLWMDSDDNKLYIATTTAGGWSAVQDVAIQTAINNAATAKAVADGKMRIFTQASPPAGLTADDVGDMWIDTDDSNVSYTWELVAGTTYGWTKRQLGNGAIVPQSLIASDVIATGTVSAALLEAVLVLATEIIAGDPLGTHARMTPTGFRVFREDPVDGIPNEVARLGTETNDYFGIVDATGDLIGSWDGTGAINARTANFREDIVVGGQSLSALLAISGSGRIVGRYRGTLGANLEPIRPEIGVVEANAYLDNTRFYDIKWRLSWRTNQMPSDVTFRVRSTVGVDSNTAPTPTINSYTEEAWTKAQTSPNYQHTDEGSVRISPAANGRHRFLLTMAVGDPNGSGNTTGSVMGARQIDLSIVDAGPRGLADGGSISRGEGVLQGQATPTPPPATVQNYFVELAPAGWKSWNADNTLRGATDTNRNGINGPIQGIAPGTSGSQKGHWWFAIPNISGTISRMEFYVWADHWYLNSGGTGVFNVAWLTQGGPIYPKHKGDHLINGIPKPGGTNWILPSDWWEYYTNHPPGGLRADGITVGPTGNFAHEYGRFNGDSARLKIWWTQ